MRASSRSSFWESCDEGVVLLGMLVTPQLGLAGDDEIATLRRSTSHQAWWWLLISLIAIAGAPSSSLEARRALLLQPGTWLGNDGFVGSSCNLAGLALLGGASIASGGFGMVGGLQHADRLR